MNAGACPPKVLLIDSNVYFSKKLGDALKKEGFEVLTSSQAAYSLTMLEWNTPAVILCATNLREMNAYEIAPLLRADTKTANIPLIAVGNGGDSWKHFATVVTIMSIGGAAPKESPPTSGPSSSAGKKASSPRKWFRAP